MQDARDDELPLDQIAHILHRTTVEQFVGELHRDLRNEFLLVGKLGERLVLLLELHFKCIAHDDQRQDDTHDAQRIGDGISERNARQLLLLVPRERLARGRQSVGIGLLRGTESRRVGHGTRQDADHRRNGRARDEVDDVGRRNAQQHDGRGAADQRQAAVLERREETRTDLQTYRKDEQDQTELLHEVAHVAVDRHAEVTQGDTDEEDPRDAERYAADLDLAEQNAECDHQCDREDRMGDAATEKKGM